MFKRFLQALALVLSLVLIVTMFVTVAFGSLFKGQGWRGMDILLLGAVLSVLFLVVPMWIAHLERRIAELQLMRGEVGNRLDRELAECGKQGDWIRTVLSQGNLDQALTGLARNYVEAKRQAIALTRGVWAPPEGTGDPLQAFRKELEGRVAASTAALEKFDRVKDRAMRNGYSIRPLEDYLPEEDRPGVSQRV